MQKYPILTSFGDNITVYSLSKGDGLVVDVNTYIVQPGGAVQLTIYQPDGLVVTRNFSTLPGIKWAHLIGVACRPQSIKQDFRTNLKPLMKVVN